MRVIPEISVVCPVQSHTMIGNIDDTHTWGQPPLASDPFWDDSPVKVKDIGRMNVPKQDNVVKKITPTSCTKLTRTDRPNGEKESHTVHLTPLLVGVSRHARFNIVWADLILDPGGGAKLSNRRAVNETTIHIGIVSRVPFELASRACRAYHIRARCALPTKQRACGIHSFAHVPIYN